MPASLTRTCPSCKTERATPADFREVGETGPGRPPKICRACRHADPVLLAHHFENVARRPSARSRQSAYAARPDSEIAAARALLRGGMKTCPEVAGCGRLLPYRAFATNRHQADGLSPICRDCQDEHEAIRSLRDS